jgi:carbonic anhydrase
MFRSNSTTDQRLKDLKKNYQSQTQIIQVQINDSQSPIEIDQLSQIMGTLQFNYMQQGQSIIKSAHTF